MYILKPYIENDLASNITLTLHNHEIRRQYFRQSPEEEIRKVLGMPESFIITNPDGRIIYFTRQMLQLTECTEREFVMQPMDKVLTLFNDRTGGQLPNPVPEAIGQKHVVHLGPGTAVVTRTGDHKPVSVTARPLPDNRDELLGVMIQIREESRTGARTAGPKKI